MVRQVGRLARRVQQVLNKFAYCSHSNFWAFSWEPHAHLANAAEAVADYLRELHNVFLPIVPMLQEN